MYEFMILGQLARCPMHGYLIAKILGDIIGPFRCVRWGALYPLLTRLEQEGLIQAVADDPSGDGRLRKVYAITDAGRERLHQHLMDTERHLGEYDAVFYQKVALFSQLTTEERLSVSRHYAVYAQQNVDHLKRERLDLVKHKESLLLPEQLHDILTVMDHRIAYWRGERAWAEELIAEHLSKEAV